MNRTKRDEQFLDLIERQTQVLQTIAETFGVLNQLDDVRKADIDELREEVASLGAKVDALSVAVVALRDHTVGRESAPVDPVAQSRGQVKW